MFNLYGNVGYHELLSSFSSSGWSTCEHLDDEVIFYHISIKNYAIIVAEREKFHFGKESYKWCIVKTDEDKKKVLEIIEYGDDFEYLRSLAENISKIYDGFNCNFCGDHLCKLCRIFAKAE
jgi:hypothetical protein